MPVDLAFIDGMHWFEFALRDFLNIERRSHAATVVVFDDVFPAHPWQAERDRRTRVWTGDIWKIAACLRKYRPDLVLIPCDTWPTGMLLVLGLDAANETLSRNYERLVQEFVERDDPMVPTEVIARAGAGRRTTCASAPCLTVFARRDSPRILPPRRGPYSRRFRQPLDPRTRSQGFSHRCSPHAFR